MARHFRISAVLTGAAVLGMAATPAAAIELPSRGSAATERASPAAWSEESVAAERSRHRHRQRHWRHRDNGIDAGDVIAGAVIIGGIAALAGAFDNDRDERRDDYRYPQPNYQGGGLDRAADMCVAEIERDVRVASVDGVDRTAGGWRVSGSLYDGERFTCRIGNDGRISDIDYGRGGVSYTTEARGNQWDDETYAAAWGRVDGGTAQPLPAYPGGPLPGETYEGY
ncbi:hypothetical protein [Pelagerythrobacter rhizovicinus]|uniref:Uncharacterized protein n=1 Tax=Pelagerythrobacter rhizovicinus TaxID=2268576 RepID=A0A4Q2KQ10_9SPHN|nr:hypothetical protein [Pelagerythrobacter rhizovicinus]RXZ66480.1 hypothetical protein ETX26_07320 [Pelagerythrobacter rhizovicinus]